MKYIASRFILFMCIVGITAIGAVVVHAEDNPTISVITDKVKKNAYINIDKAGIMFYSVQLTLDMNADSKYTLTPYNGKAYGTLKQNEENNTVTIYIDSIEPNDGSGEICIAFISSDKEMNIGNTAELILVDRSMRPVSYAGIKVNVSESDITTPKPTKKPGSSGGGGGGGGGGSSSSAGATSSPKESPAADVTPGPTLSPTESPAIGSAPDVSAEPDTSSEKKPIHFEDTDNHWAKEYIEYVTEKGLFNGTSDTLFEPDAEMTRAMYVSVLMRFETNPKWKILCDNPVKFDDVDDEEWYSEAAAWAGGIGLVQGIGNNMFAPSSPVTREQIAVITMNFANLCGAEFPKNIETENFTDDADISAWAAEAVSAARQAGLIYGRPDGTFAPKDTVTRAEVAAVICRFIDIYGMK
ncbi:MAG: S-layer homology domain-containing protein [Oscillospiraceae bacterium]|nr:S-layer homology domain-containing protein [Oscillospiraceae bacterium]